MPQPLVLTLLPNGVSANASFHGRQQGPLPAEQAILVHGDLPFPILTARGAGVSNGPIDMGKLDGGADWVVLQSRGEIGASARFYVLRETRWAGCNQNSHTCYF
jgi:hypothetical protein